MSNPAPLGYVLVALVGLCLAFVAVTTGLLFLGSQNRTLEEMERRSAQNVVEHREANERAHDRLVEQCGR